MQDHLRLKSYVLMHIFWKYIADSSLKCHMSNWKVFSDTGILAKRDTFVNI